LTRLSLLNVGHLRVGNLTLNLGSMFGERGTELLRVVEGPLLVLADALVSVEHLLLLSL